MLDWIPTQVVEVLQSVPFRILILIVLALVVRGVLARMITSAFRRAADSRPYLSLGSKPDVRRAQRLKALGSMVRSVTSVLVFVIFASIILAELGFNITGLLTGTTIVAATVAFGMQNVIKDLVAGVSMLIEDQLGVGDYVDLEEASGTVERVGLRTTTVRDDNGNVWYVRNGEVTRVGNFSQGGTARPVPTDQQVLPVRLVEPADEQQRGPADGEI
ncbi:mechanosensitive ion channel family protein [Naumannella halotolerans]|uniref:Small conductance mechanosensitive channel n=1 Tax=Naumannella halotolerans TaxID=993414 RepID=A0A4R7JAT8_9ACTN|nr:mechanosensitive ion channel domain-containing protein [Naumannella halotolerans]TDT34036.1 small conductance mechanosensitive channel [Naumannella halotolerans]